MAREPTAMEPDPLGTIAKMWPKYIAKPGTQELYVGVLSIAMQFDKTYDEVLTELAKVMYGAPGEEQA